MYWIKSVRFGCVGCGVQGVVPFVVPGVAGEGELVHPLVADLDPGGVGVGVKVGGDGQPVVVVVAPMRLMIVSWLSGGLPRRFMVIWANRRCSIWGEMRPDPGPVQGAP